VGYAVGPTPNPTYEDLSSGRTGHNKAVLVVFDPKRVTYEELLKVFFESHDPTQGMRQGNDVGTQYRSGIYVYSDAQARAAEAAERAYERALAEKGFDAITTEILQRRPSTSRKVTTNNISPRIHTVIAVSAVLVCPARSVRASAPRLS
jgi:peptide-methionine (S)-S-oxide reductase